MECSSSNRISAAVQRLLDWMHRTCGHTVQSSRCSSAVPWYKRARLCEKAQLGGWASRVCAAVDDALRLPAATPGAACLHRPATEGPTPIRVPFHSHRLRAPSHPIFSFSRSPISNLIPASSPPFPSISLPPSIHPSSHPPLIQHPPPPLLRYQHQHPTKK